MDGSCSFDLDAYLARVGYPGPVRPTAEDLAGLHLAHVAHIPFENLTILLGRPIRLDLGSLHAKLVEGRRGGYCFEQNTLFAATLERLGFTVVPLAARVRLGTTCVLPRTHMLLRVEAEGGSWIADVGFGGARLLQPLPLQAGRVERQFVWSYRLTEQAGLWLLQSRRDDQWEDLYAFTLEPQHPIDFEVANHYTSTHPASHFTQTLTVQLSTPEARYALREREFTLSTGEQLSSRTVKDDDELLYLLDETFRLHFPVGMRFRRQADPA